MNSTTDTSTRHDATIVREYGPFPGVERVHGVTQDGTHVWFACGERIAAMNPDTGALEKELAVPGDAGTAFDGVHLYQLADAEIRKVDPRTGQVVATIPAPGQGRDSGMAWDAGTLWVGQYKERCIHQIDATSGKILKTIRSDRFVTGVSWVEGDLWHGTWEGDTSDLRRVDPETGRVLEKLDMPEGVHVSGLEADAKGEVFYCGGGPSGKLRAVKRPRRAKA